MRCVHPPSARCRRGRQTRPGFSLIETATATLIMSIAVVAMCQVLASGAAATTNGTDMTRAVYLAGAIHELALSIPHAPPARPAVIGPCRSVRDLNGVTFSPAVDASASPMPDCQEWTQQVLVQNVDTTDMSAADAPDRSASTVRLTVTVSHHGRCVYSGSWLMNGDAGP